MNLFHRSRRQRIGAVARIVSATLATASIMSISIGLQGCIENPGADHRLNKRDRAYSVIATAEYAEESVLELSVKHDSGAISLRILSIAREPIDSASFLLQFGERRSYSYTEPRLYHRESKLNVIIRIANLQPGAVLDYGAISRDMDLENTLPSAKLIRFADGAPRGNPLGGVYSGNYWLKDATGRRNSAPMKGIITVGGEYQFLTEMTFMGEGIKGDFYGLLDSTRTEGFLSGENFGGATHVTNIPAPFTLDSGTLTGTFLFSQTLSWYDSLRFEMPPMRFIGE